MQQRKEINWWVVAAVIVIGIPVGFVIMGIISKSNVPKFMDSSIDSPLNNDSTVFKNDTLVLIEIEKDLLKKRQQEEAERRRQLEEQRKLEEAERRCEALRQQEEAERRRQLEEQRKLKEVEQRREALRQQEEAERRRQLEEQRKLEEAEKQREVLRQQKEAKEKQLRNEILGIVVAGRQDNKVPNGCPIVVNGEINTNYMNFRTGMTLGAYSDVSITKVEIDADATRATRVYTNAKVNLGEDESNSLPEQNIEFSEEQRRLEEKRIKQDTSRKQEEEQQRQLLNEIQKVMVSGEPNSKVPNGCSIVVNGKVTVNYMNFCTGVRLGSYSDINVTNVECNATIVTKIYVNAKMKSVED